ncbi:MAG: ATP-binding protein DrrA1-3 family domain-containing protein, partial [Candidatus Aquicultor sp.]
KASFSGEVVELIARPQREAQRLVKTLHYVFDVEIYGERLQLTVSNAGDAAERLKRDLAGKVELVSVVPKAPTMESAFIEMIKNTRNKSRG